MNQKKKISLKPELQKFIENIAAIYEGYGIPRIGGRIFGLSLVFGEPLSAEDMSALIQASRSSISTNIRALMLNGWIEKVTFPGDRIDYFRFSPQAWERVLEHRKEALFPIKQIVERGQHELAEDSLEHQQLEDMKAWLDIQAHYQEEMLKAWRKHIRDKQRR